MLEKVQEALKDNPEALAEVSKVEEIITTQEKTTA